MENTKLLFYGTEQTGTDIHRLEIYAAILTNTIDFEFNDSVVIALNKSTAIKLSKELKKQISKLS